MRKLICRILRHHVPAVTLTGLAADEHALCDTRCARCGGR
jgi:hypothetical protein